MTDPTREAGATEPEASSSGAANGTGGSESGEATTISRLDRDTIERIAAGEVVTRPASVCKELIENSLDAGASNVRVAVEEGGKERITVADDGYGMDSEDALLAVERHTTSKIREPEDVGRVATLGFRGEALASIAKMSRLTLTTKTGGVRGTKVTIDGSGEREANVAGRDIGTTVEAEDLFYNTPARRKSLASTKAEFAAISSLLTRYALCRPDVRFRLEHDDREVFSTPGSGRHTDAVLGTYGREVASRSTEIARDASSRNGEKGGSGYGYRDGDADNEGGEDDEEEIEIEVEGLLAHPSVTRANPDHVHTAVNGRALSDETIRESVLAGYGTLLPSDRYPIAVLDISIPPEQVDANVHPRKAEIKFREPDRVARAVEKAVQEALEGVDLSRVEGLDFDLDASLEPVEGESVFETGRVIGRFRSAYVLCEAEEDLLVIDQHAAHERINYERLSNAIGERVESAPIDPPATVALSPPEAAALEAERETVAALGFGVEHVGGGMARISKVPAPFGRVSEPTAIRDALDALAEGGGRSEGKSEPADPREELLKRLACHPSLKAGEDLSEERAAELLARLGACEQPFACPHGRPTVLSIDERAFVRGFERGSRRLG
ncbi:DNA mismatch repair protein MutL [Halobacteriales archaeon QS_3_64_16]|nr:MAG: DNA mismatch repair protein MutL [Halobacteriales archaeon QS_3_64_16]